MVIKVLHVEDDSDIREIVKLSLEMDGDFEITQAEDGIIALDIAQRTAFDVFLLDMMMPKMSGTETLEGLRKLPACDTIPAIFMTARVQENEKAELQSFGCVDIIAKPFDPMTLGDRIKSVLEH